MIDFAVYVGASSDEMERARSAMAALRAAGIRVTSTWCEVIAAQSAGVGNPRDASNADRLAWSANDLAEVAASSLLWFLVPKVATGRGGYCEFGYAHGLGVTLVTSGDTKQSTFTALGEEFADDVAAFDYIVKLARAAERLKAVSP